MKGRIRAAPVLLTTAIALGVPAPALAETPSPIPSPSPSPPPQLGRAWLINLEGIAKIPPDVAIRFGEAAMSVGLTKIQAANLLNDETFIATTISSDDQHHGLLLLMTEHPEYIRRTWDLLHASGQVPTASGPASLQSRLFADYPELVNPYLKDFGHMLVPLPDGSVVMIDLATGRRIVAAGVLGDQVTQPGGGALVGRYASMGSAAPTVPAFPTPSPTALEQPPGAQSPLPGGPWTIPGRHPRGVSPALLWAVAAAFGLAWLGYAVVAFRRRLLRHV